ncbi:glycosyltransferase family 4 protein [Alsobacter sp. SYSU M60028]|uniref:Glycosyltransferase family 4 protein n=1 Tax=Alsobacter ponti TaxID=2962936 RepID=A0ABT1LDV0_9HYPH|nr:glycosyltransferase family 4 protein [Alsobacter ponti]MCP8938418.1 glycosyltransferase family 4 protein [Alsobacter ponti]
MNLRLKPETEQGTGAGADRQAGAREMHIVLVAPLPEPHRTARGGVERVTEVLRKGLAAHARVSVVVPNASIALRTRDEFGEIRYLKRAGIPGFLSYWSHMSRAVLAQLRDLRPDLVHVQDMGGVALFWPRRGALDVPLVFTVHGILDQDIRQSAGEGLLRAWSRGLRARVVQAVEAIARSRFDRVVLINPYVLEALPDLVGRSVQSIANPVDRCFLDAEFSAPPAAGDRFRLLQVGVISARKNVAASISLVSALRERGIPATLDIVGPVVEADYFESCKALVAEKGLGEAVTFHGGVSPAELVGWFDRSDVLLLVSGQETAPMVVAEAHCRGLPVAVRPSFGFRYMVEDGVNGVFLEGHSVQDDAGKLAEMARVQWNRPAIRAAARELYDPDVIVRETLALYRRMLDPAGAAKSPDASRTFEPGAVS